MRTVSTMGRECLLGADSVYRLHRCVLPNLREHTTSKSRLLNYLDFFHCMADILLLFEDRI